MTHLLTDTNTPLNSHPRPPPMAPAERRQIIKFGCWRDGPPAIAANAKVLGLPGGKYVPIIPDAAGQATAKPRPARALTILRAMML